MCPSCRACTRTTPHGISHIESGNIQIQPFQLYDPKGFMLHLETHVHGAFNFLTLASRRIAQHRYIIRSTSTATRVYPKDRSASFQVMSFIELSEIILGKHQIQYKKVHIFCQCVHSQHAIFPLLYKQTPKRKNI